MKKIIILATITSAIGINCYAQQSATRYGENFGLYYSPVVIGPNGFRTVEEENRLMTQTLADLKKQHEREDMSQEEIANAVKKHDEETAAKKNLFNGKKPDSSKVKK